MDEAKLALCTVRLPPRRAALPPARPPGTDNPPPRPLVYPHRRLHRMTTHTRISLRAGKVWGCSRDHVGNRDRPQLLHVRCPRSESLLPGRT
jgi:hypothetical protein